MKDVAKATLLALATTATAAAAMPFDLPTNPWVVNRFVQAVLGFFGIPS